MSLIIREGSIFDSEAEAYTNTINCVGVMGAGIAKEFKERYPVYFKQYRNLCDSWVMAPGGVFLHQEDDIKIISVAVKNHWRNWATEEYVMNCIYGFKNLVRDYKINTVNTPLWASKNGVRGPDGLEKGLTKPPTPAEMLDLMIKHFEPIETEVRLYLMK